METGIVFDLSVFWAQSDSASSIQVTWTREVTVILGSVTLETLDLTSSLFCAVETLSQYAGLDAGYTNPA